MCFGAKQGCVLQANVKSAYLQALQERQHYMDQDSKVFAAFLLPACTIYGINPRQV